MLYFYNILEYRQEILILEVDGGQSILNTQS